MSSGGGAYSTYPWWKKWLLVWEHEGAEYFTQWIMSWKVEPFLVAVVILFAITGIALSVDSDAVTATAEMLIALSPVWLPIFLLVFLLTSWIHYVRYIFWFKQEYVLLEIELPPEVEKSPQTIELILARMWNIGGETTFIHRIINGQTRLVWSLEIASIEGRIGFYIHMRRSWKNIIEATFYGQFPEARLREVEDYIGKIPFNLVDYKIFGAEFSKSTTEALPIRSYIDYELDKDTDKPETKVDPITNMLEFMGTLGKGEYLWTQLIIRPRKADDWYGFYLKKKGGTYKDFVDSYRDNGQAEILNILQGAAKRAKKIAGLAEDEEGRVTTQLTSGEKLKIDAIEHSFTKLIYDTGIRTVYVAKNEAFHPVNIGGVVRFFNAYRYNNFNALNPTRGHAGLDYPWQDFADIRKNKLSTNLFFWSKYRAHFYVPYDQQGTCLTTEELATLWHFPNSMVKTPGLQRVPSRVSEAPTNLPV